MVSAPPLMSPTDKPFPPSQDLAGGSQAIESWTTHHPCALPAFCCHVHTPCTRRSDAAFRPCDVRPSVYYILAWLGASQLLDAPLRREQELRQRHGDVLSNPGKVGGLGWAGRQQGADGVRFPTLTEVEGARRGGKLLQQW